MVLAAAAALVAETGAGAGGLSGWGDEGVEIVSAEPTTREKIMNEELRTLLVAFFLFWIYFRR